jgi:hypothetical protein
MGAFQKLHNRTPYFLALWQTRLLSLEKLIVYGHVRSLQRRVEVA